MVFLCRSILQFYFVSCIFDDAVVMDKVKNHRREGVNKFV